MSENLDSLLEVKTQTNAAQQGSRGPTDLKKLSRFIILLGAVIFAYGAVKLLANMPVDASDFQDQNQPSSSSGVYNWSAAVQRTFGAGIQAHDENMLRADARGTAVVAMIAGGIIAFIGFGVSASVKKSSEEPEAHKKLHRPERWMDSRASSPISSEEAATQQASDPHAVLCPFCSKPLERGTWQGY